MRVKPNGNRFIGFNLPDSLLIDFQKKYPKLMTVFFRRCLIRACASDTFFNDVFFKTIDNYGRLGENNPKIYLDMIKDK